MKARDYQEKSKTLTFDFIRDNPGKNPCLKLPTGAGKSHVVALMCKEALQNWPETRILMLTHVKELIEQNAEKMYQYWPNAPMGIYSASVGKKQLGEPITFGGIQSLRGKAGLIGHIDLVVIDECHLVNTKDEGSYRALINDLKQINEHIVIIGLTATPFRLGSGLITDGENALFHKIIDPISIEELIDKGHLAKLQSKKTDLFLDTDGVHKRGGEFIERELQEAVNKLELNEKIVLETIKRAGDRKHWLFFCTGVDHAHDMAKTFNQYGITAETITGQNTKRERENIIERFRAGEIKVLTNANVLTTGFDFPDIDLIGFCRPTLSPALYMQMAGRGLRIKNHTDHCLVLDFAKNIEKHGPITCVNPPRKGKGDGVAPVKDCPECAELIHASLMLCPTCGYEFPQREKEEIIEPSSKCIMGFEDEEVLINSWRWSVHTSKTSGKDMLKVKYYPGLNKKPITEYLCVTHDGFAGEKAINTLATIASASNAEDVFSSGDLSEASVILNDATHPESITYRQKGKFYEVKSRRWATTNQPRRMKL